MNVVRFLVAWTACAILGAIPAWAFTPDDQVVIGPDVNIVDPEFDSVGQRMVWQDEHGNLWVADLDPYTGAIIPPDGRGVLVDTGLFPMYLSGNGPEWTYGGGSVYIAYTKSVGGIPYLGAAKLDTQGNWVPKTLQKGSHRWRAFGTPESNSSEPRLLYVRQTAPGQTVLSWRDLGNPATERTIAGAAGVGRWVEGQRAFVTLQQFLGVLQVVTVDSISGAVTQITNDAGAKLEPFIWWAPEWNDYLLMTKIGNTKVGIYRQNSGAGQHWTRIQEIVLPSSKPFVSSPEPFVAGDKSYLFIIAADKLGVVGSARFHPVGPSEVWVVGIELNGPPLLRRVDDPTTEANRTDPEVYHTTSGPVIFYTELDEASGGSMLRRAATGLSP